VNPQSLHAPTKRRLLDLYVWDDVNPLVKDITPEAWSFIKRLPDALQKFPSSLSIAGQQQISVVINGAEALANLVPALQGMIETQTTEKIRAVFRDHLPDLGAHTAIN
jgi:hypothetical protein